MSKLLKAILPVALPLLLILHSFNNSFGQKITVTITVPVEHPSMVEFKGRFDGVRSPDGRNLWFLKDFAGYNDLGSRFSNIVVADPAGRSVDVRQLIPGEFLADSDFQNWSYKADLSPPGKREAAAHVSWIAADRGIVMLTDLLPQSHSRTQATVEFLLPTGWQIFSTENKVGDKKFEVRDLDKAVFIVGKGFRNRSLADGANLIVSGEWQFSDDDAASIAKEIYASYIKTLGGAPAGTEQIALMKFAAAATPGIWEADTRGSSVTVLSSDMPFKAQSLQRLHEQLRHEIFHLWIPNAVNLRGSYDWFYEGFALYLSLKNGVLMNRIRLDDFLDTLSRAYAIDSFQKPRLTLVEASQKRWSGGNTTVYARGLIAAFLCDLALLKNSKGRTDASNIVKDLYEKYHAQPAAVDGNEAVLGVMQKYPHLTPIIEKYVKGSSAIDWTADLDSSGIASVEQNSVTVLKTVEKPTGSQRQILDKLGYNSWRKLTDSSK